MGGLGLAHKQELLAASVAVPLFLALCARPVNPDVDTGSTIVEVVYNGYARLAVAPAAWLPPDGYGRVVNAVPLSFPAVVSAVPGTIGVWWSLLDAATGGTLRWAGPTPPVAVTATDPVITFPPGLLALALS